METKGVGRGLWDIFTGKKLVASTDKRKEKGKAKAEDDPRNFERGFRPEDIPRGLLCLTLVGLETHA